MSFLTGAKDYVEILHQLVETDASFNVNNIIMSSTTGGLGGGSPERGLGAAGSYNDFGNLLTYFVVNTNNFFNFQWLQTIWSWPILVPDISNAMISEISIIGSGLFNQFTNAHPGISSMPLPPSGGAQPGINLLDTPDFPNALSRLNISSNNFLSFLSKNGAQNPSSVAETAININQVNGFINLNPELTNLGRLAENSESLKEFSRTEQNTNLTNGTLQIPALIERFMIGFLNSFFLFLPTSTAHFITLRRFIFQGTLAGFVSGLGTIFGNVFWLSSIIFGWRFLLIPWLSFDILRYFLGFILIIRYFYDLFLETSPSATPIKISSWPPKLFSNFLSRRLPAFLQSKPAKEFKNSYNSTTKMFWLNFLLAFTEQSNIYPFIGNISLRSSATSFEGFPASNYMEFLAIHSMYILGIFVGSLSLLKFTYWLFEEPFYRLYLWVLSTWPRDFYTQTAKRIKFLFLYITMIFAICSIPYYGLDYILMNPLGLVNNDVLLQHKVFLESSFINTTPSDYNTRQNRFRHSSRERWNRRLKNYRSLDTVLYDGAGTTGNTYDLLTIEDTNYGFDRFWYKRKKRSHEIRYRLIPAPLVGMLKKSLLSKRLKNERVIRLEFFDLLYQYYYHPSFHDLNPSNSVTKSLFNLKDKKVSLSASGDLPTISPSSTDLTYNITGTNPSYSGPFLKTGIGTARFFSSSSDKQRNSALRKFVRKVTTRSSSGTGRSFPIRDSIVGVGASPFFETAAIPLNLSSESQTIRIESGRRIPENTRLNLQKNTLRIIAKELQKPIYSKRWKRQNFLSSSMPESNSAETGRTLRTSAAGRNTTDLSPDNAINLQKVFKKVLRFVGDDYGSGKKNAFGSVSSPRSMSENSQATKWPGAGAFSVPEHRFRKKLSKKDLQILRYRGFLSELMPSKQSQHSSILKPLSRQNQASKEADVLRGSQKIENQPRSIAESNGSQEKQPLASMPFFKQESGANLGFIFSKTQNLVHPIKLTLEKEDIFRRKLQYYGYGVKLFRKMEINNPSPYFKTFLKRFFYYYKPTRRWQKTIRPNKKTRRFGPKVPRVAILPPLFSSAEQPPRGGLSSTALTNRVAFTPAPNDQLSTLRGTSDGVVRASAPQVGLDMGRLETSKNIQNMNLEIVRPTHLYSLQSKKAQRCRRIIHKDVMLHNYYAPLNRFLMERDIDFFINRQPKAHFLTKKEEHLLHLRRFLLLEHYNTLRWYNNVNQKSANYSAETGLNTGRDAGLPQRGSQTKALDAIMPVQLDSSLEPKVQGFDQLDNVKENQNNVKSFSNKIYNQQFQGTFKKIRHLFAMTPNQGMQSILKFDQNLYNDSAKESFNGAIEHEELASSSQKISSVFVLEQPTGRAGLMPEPAQQSEADYKGGDSSFVNKTQNDNNFRAPIAYQFLKKMAFNKKYMEFYEENSINNKSSMRESFLFVISQYERKKVKLKNKIKFFKKWFAGNANTFSLQHDWRTTRTGANNSDSDFNKTPSSSSVIPTSIRKGLLRAISKTDINPNSAFLASQLESGLDSITSKRTNAVLPKSSPLNIFEAPFTLILKTKKHYYTDWHKKKRSRIKRTSNRRKLLRKKFSFGAQEKRKKRLAGAMGPSANLNSNIGGLSSSAVPGLSKTSDSGAAPLSSTTGGFGGDRTATDSKSNLFKSFPGSNGADSGSGFDAGKTDPTSTNPLWSLHLKGLAKGRKAQVSSGFDAKTQIPQDGTDSLSLNQSTVYQTAIEQTKEVLSNSSINEKSLDSVELTGNGKLGNSYFIKKTRKFLIDWKKSNLNTIFDKLNPNYLNSQKESNQYSQLSIPLARPLGIKNLFQSIRPTFREDTFDAGYSISAEFSGNKTDAPNPGSSVIQASTRNDSRWIFTGFGKKDVIENISNWKKKSHKKRRTIHLTRGVPIRSAKTIRSRLLMKKKEAKQKLQLFKKYQKLLNTGFVNNEQKTQLKLLALAKIQELQKALYYSNTLDPTRNGAFGPIDSVSQSSTRVPEGRNPLDRRPAILEQPPEKGTRYSFFRRNISKNQEEHNTNIVEADRYFYFDNYDLKTRRQLSKTKRNKKLKQTRKLNRKRKRRTKKIRQNRRMFSMGKAKEKVLRKRAKELGLTLYYQRWLFEKYLPNRLLTSVADRSKNITANSLQMNSVDFGDTQAVELNSPKLAGSLTNNLSKIAEVGLPAQQTCDRETTLCQTNRTTIQPPFLVPVNPLPFYAGWDESLRKFVITNKLLSRRNAGYESQSDILFTGLAKSPGVSLKSPTSSLPAGSVGAKEQKENDSQEKIKLKEPLLFTHMPIDYLSIATNEFKTTFAPFAMDQAFSIGHLGHAPLGWRRFKFKGLKSLTPSGFASFRAVGTEEGSPFEGSRSLNTQQMNVKKLETLKQGRRLSKYSMMKEAFNWEKQSPRDFPHFSGTLIQEYLPMSYPYIANRRFSARDTDSRYLDLEANIFKMRSIKANIREYLFRKRNDNISGMDNSKTVGLEFTFRRRPFPTRYYRVRSAFKAMKAFPRRVKFLGDMLTWRPLSAYKTNTELTTNDGNFIPGGLALSLGQETPSPTQTILGANSKTYLLNLENWKSRGFPLDYSISSTEDSRRQGFKSLADNNTGANAQLTGTSAKTSPVDTNGRGATDKENGFSSFEQVPNSGGEASNGVFDAFLEKGGAKNQQKVAKDKSSILNQSQTERIQRRASRLVKRLRYYVYVPKRKFSQKNMLHIPDIGDIIWPGDYLRLAPIQLPFLLPYQKEDIINSFSPSNQTAKALESPQTTNAMKNQLDIILHEKKKAPSDEISLNTLNLISMRQHNRKFLIEKHNLKVLKNKLKKALRADCLNKKLEELKLRS
uniref:Hypothetical chloroplast RF1 n=1 Tax=Staurocarteria cerasiformis TaxID=69401 RepID=A0A0S2LPY7_STACE|nr:hypothetical chloroplast RF1 [Carteria cerasiformis]ALO63467.1 hypothetical chloroplast RF1 [Carteria cerasiformis]